MDLDTKIIAVFCRIDDALKRLFQGQRLVKSRTVIPSKTCAMAPLRSQLDYRPIGSRTGEQSISPADLLRFQGAPPLAGVEASAWPRPRTS